MKKTMIQISTEVRDELKKIGRMGETYTDVISRLVEKYHENLFAEHLIDTKDCVDVEKLLKKENII